MSESPKPRIDPSIIAALIGVVGTIIVTFITLRVNQPRALESTPIPPAAVFFTETIAPSPNPTDTVEVGDPSSTPEPPTSTPEPIPTPTVIPAGADWTQNCISSVWRPFPTDIVASRDDKGCLIQLVDRFYTSSGRLGFTFDERVTGATMYGLFTQLPTDGTASIRFHLNQITTGEVMIGVFAQPDVTSKGALLVMPSNNNVKNQRMLLKTMPGQETFSQTSGPLHSDTATYDATFSFTGGTVEGKLSNNQVDLESVPVLSAEKWLFVGYQVLNGTNRIQAEFFDLVITPR